MLKHRNLKMDDFLQKLKKVVRIGLYGPAISQSDCKKAGPYQLSYTLHTVSKPNARSSKFDSEYDAISITSVAEHKIFMK